MTEALITLDESVCGLLNVIHIEAANGNHLSLVVGGEETVLGFVHAHRDPPYYASSGSATGDEPVMTCYASHTHHTEFPRRCVIPLSQGLAAVREFVRAGTLPKSVDWIET